LKAVTSDVSESPNNLLADVKYWGRKKIDESMDSICGDHDLAMFSGPRSDVG
jgi:hypothetical protein